MYLINLQGKESINEQIKKQIIRFVDLGVLKPNDKLPSVRMLAQDLGINPNTVAKAYQQLEEEGIIYTINKKGVFVQNHDEDEVGALKAEMYVRDLKDQGIPKGTLLKIIDTVYLED